jgi:hypothetical protein
MKVVVTTPTGHVGSRVVRLLLQGGLRPTLLLRDPAKLDPQTRHLVDVVQVEGFVGMASGLRGHFAPEDPRSILTTTPTTLRSWAVEHLAPHGHLHRGPVPSVRRGGPPAAGG